MAAKVRILTIFNYQHVGKKAFKKIIVVSF